MSESIIFKISFCFRKRSFRRVSLRVCSLIIHLHLNRLRHPLVLPYLKAPGGKPGLCPGCLAERLERVSEAGVHVEGGNVVYVGGHHAEV